MSEMDLPQISRSGRVLKKSTKVKEMEDFDINELDVQGKPRKKGRLSDEYDEFDDKRIAPIKIPKTTLNLPPGAKRPQMMSKMTPTKRYMMHDSSPDGSKESDSTSMSSETSSSSASSSEDSEGETPPSRQAKGPSQQGKVIVESYRQQFEAPFHFGDQSSEAAMDNSEESDSGLVIAEESNDSFMSRQKLSSSRKTTQKRTPGPGRGGSAKKRPPGRQPTLGGRTKKEKPAGKPKAQSAYMLWCNENRKKIMAAGNVGFGTIGKKLGEAWQALPDKEKMAWRRKSKKLARE